LAYFLRQFHPHPSRESDNRTSWDYRDTQYNDEEEEKEEEGLTGREEGE
jgi:hypothetical protein